MFTLSAAGSLWSASAVFALLLGSAALGFFVQRYLSDSHRSRDTRELSQVVISMLVTFVALVLGLLTSSVVQSFNRAGNDLDAYAINLIRLGQSLRDLGPEADPVRHLLRNYVASAIASQTSPDRQAPAPSAKSRRRARRIRA